MWPYHKSGRYCPESGRRRDSSVRRSRKGVEQRLLPRGVKLKHHSIAGGASSKRRTEEVACGVLNESPLRSYPICSALETMQHREGTCRAYLKYCPGAGRAAVRGRAVEITCGILDQVGKKELPPSAPL